MNLSDKTALVIDHGTFVEFALRIARQPGGFGRVLYHCPFEYGYSHVNDAIIGNGFSDVGLEWCEDPLDPAILRQVDVACFPDVQHAGLQLLIEEFGVPVWGSRKGDSLELLRGKFRNALTEMKLPIPKYEHVIGLANLRAYLRDHPDVYIKISKFRGSMETRHHINMQLSESWLDQKACEFGAMKNEVPFIVEDAINDAVEVGLDSFNISGKFPDTALYGIEIKDKGYIGEVRKMEEMPGPILEISKRISPILAGYNYRNWISMELRITEDSVPYFTDPCQRLASPGGESMLEIYGNIPQFVFDGAQGRLTEPEPTGKFAAQCWIEHCDDPRYDRSIQIEDEYRNNVKLRFCCKVGNTYHIIPQPDVVPDNHVGFVVGVGDTAKESIMQARMAADSLRDQNVIVHTEGLDDAAEEWNESTVDHPEVLGT